MTDAQRAAVQYWTGAGVLRWNEIERELVARYNLPPAPRADGSYPLPDAENPFSDPVFPFANPPYAARAYSYVSVAQYEALKAAWYWKYRFNRLSPARNDPGVATSSRERTAQLSLRGCRDLGRDRGDAQAALPRVAGGDHAQGGRAARGGDPVRSRHASDVAAGLALGKSIATLVINRARADGMGAAAGNPAMWKSSPTLPRRRARSRGRVSRRRSRPPMLMNFGSVKAWTMTPAEVVSLEPGPPPSTSSAEMKADLATVKNATDNLTREQLAIALKWNDGAGTATPPGHWNAIASDYVRDARMSEVRAARVFALLNMAMHDVAVGCWDTKMKNFNPRPSQLDPSIKTMIGLPNFPAFPSGHSTFSAAAATTLGAIFPQGATTFDAMADEAGLSRLYGRHPLSERHPGGEGTRHAHRGVGAELLQGGRGQLSWSWVMGGEARVKRGPRDDPASRGPSLCPELTTHPPRPPTTGLPGGAPLSCHV